jgi:hypothetical protein
VILGLLGALAVWWFGQLPPAAAGEPGLPDTLTFAEPVKDPVFALLIALVEEDRFGTLDRERLAAEIGRSGRETPLPVRRLREIRRERAVEADARVVLEAMERVVFAAPYKVLVYKPGKVRGSAHTAFLEWELGDVQVGETGPENVSRLEGVRLWALVEGSLELDVDGWVDRLLGGKLDDTRVIGFALFRDGGDWMGVAIGHNDDGRRRSGVFRFRDDKVLFPTPDPYKPAVRYLRAQLERRHVPARAGK